MNKRELLAAAAAATAAVVLAPTLAAPTMAQSPIPPRPFFNLSVFYLPDNEAWALIFAYGLVPVEDYDGRQRFLWPDFHSLAAALERYGLRVDRAGGAVKII